MNTVSPLDCRLFGDVGKLSAQKRQQGCTISIVIPALNEADTIEGVINACTPLLLSDTPLIDEIIVMDGGSTDSTAELAKNAGATIVSLDKATPADVSSCGKGVALWKSQFVAAGNILVFLDADIANFDSRFVTGLLGPLLDDPQVMFTKACYRRPYVRRDHGTIDDEGGRVTEILVRPLLSAWFPQVAQVKQPLAGEYAVRRVALEQVSFTSGYGVELLLLLELIALCGPSALAQVDMGTRIHRNRSVGELGRMAFGIYHVFHDFLMRNGMVTHTCAPTREMPAPDLNPAQFALCEELLPPAHSLDLYRNFPGGKCRGESC